VEVEALRDYFHELNEKQLMGKIVAKDREGDMPLQSAIYSNSDVRTIKLILEFVPETKKIMLKNRNKANETAVESSLSQEDVDVFKFLLQQCIICAALPELTCVGKVNRQCASLVHQCIQERRISHFRAYFEVLKESGAEINLCVVDEKGYTPWQYLLRYSKAEVPLVKEVLSILKEHEIPLSSLLVNNTSRETMLHKAYRSNKEEFIHLLEVDDSCRLAIDRYKRKPSQRNRRILPNQLKGESARDLPNSRDSQGNVQRPQYVPQQPAVLHRPRTVPLSATPGQHVVPSSASPGEYVVPQSATPGQHTVPSSASPGQHAVPSSASPGQHAVPSSASPGQHAIPSSASPGQHAVPSSASLGQQTVPLSTTPGKKQSHRQPPCGSTQSTNTHPPGQLASQTLKNRAEASSDDTDREHPVIQNMQRDTQRHCLFWVHGRLVHRQVTPDAHVSGDSAHVPGDDAHVPGDDAHVPGDDAHVPADNAHVPGDDAHVPADNTEPPIP
jgi:hypothetical protein